MTQQKASKPPNEKLLQAVVNDEQEFCDLDIGWAWVVLVASFGNTCLFGATQFASGIVHVILLERYQASVYLTSVVGAVHTSLIGLGGPLSSVIIDRFSCRIAIVIAGVLLTIGCLGTAYAPSIEYVIFTRGVVAGIGGAIGYTANMIVVGLYFRKRRNLAIGLSNSGAGVGICILAPLMQNIYDFYGPVGFSVILAGIFAQMIIFGTACFPSKLEHHVQRRRKREEMTSMENRTKCFHVLRRYTHMLKNRSVTCLSAGMFIYSLGLFVVYMYLPSNILSKGFSAKTAANFVSLSGILTVVGRVTTGILANTSFINDIYLYCIQMLIVGTATFIYPSTAWSFAGNVTYVVILGLFFGNVYVLTTSITMKYVGIENISLAIGLQYLFGGIGTLFGPVLAGFLVDAGGTYDQAFYVSATCMLLAGVISGAATCFHKPQTLDTKQTVGEIEITGQEQNSAQ